MHKLNHSLFIHLIRPARGGAAAVVIVFAVLLAFAAKFGLAGIPIALILTSWFFKYAYVLFDHTVRGFDEPPTLDIQMVNPLDEQRPLAQVPSWPDLRRRDFRTPHPGLRTSPSSSPGVAALLLPASVAILGLEGNLFKAAYPVAWVRMVFGLGPLYLLVLAIIGGYCLTYSAAGRWELWLPVQIAICMFCILSIFSVLGGALYERRHELGLGNLGLSRTHRGTPQRGRICDRSEKEVMGRLWTDARRLAHRRMATIASLARRPAAMPPKTTAGSAAASPPGAIRAT